jgi:hypothetical protein
MEIVILCHDHPGASSSASSCWSYYRLVLLVIYKTRTYLLFFFLCILNQHQQHWYIWCSRALFVLYLGDIIICSCEKLCLNE